MWSNELSLAAQLVGCAVASRIALIADRLTAALWVPVTIYTGWFALLLVTSWRYEDAPRLDERGVLDGSVCARGLGPYAGGGTSTDRPCYDRRHHGRRPCFLGCWPFWSVVRVARRDRIDRAPQRFLINTDLRRGSFC